MGSWKCEGGEKKGRGDKIAICKPSLFLRSDKYFAKA